MKLYLVIGLFLITFFSVGQKQISYEAIDKPIRDVLTDLERTYLVNFSYSTDLLDSITVTISSKGKSINAFLKELLADIPFSYEIVDDSFIIIKSVKIIEGSLVDRTSGRALPYATIGFLDSNNSVISSEEGDFKIKSRDYRDSIVVISYVGYYEEKIHLDTLSSYSSLVIQLKSKIRELDEVVVTEYINQGISLNTSNNILIKPPELEVLPGLVESDILLSAQAIPGVYATDESAGNISVRGSTPGQIPTYWNGIPLYQPAHYFGNISAFVPPSIGSLTVHKNNLPLNYGHATSGLLDINSFEPNSPLGLNIGLNFTHTDITAHSILPKKLGKVLLSTRRSYNDLINTPTFESITNKVFDGSSTQASTNGLLEDEFDFTSSFLFWDIQAVYQVALGTKSNLQISYIQSQTELDFETADMENVNRGFQMHDLKNEGIGFNFEHSWSKNAQSTLEFARSNYDLGYEFLEERDFQNDQDLQEIRDNEVQTSDFRFNNEIIISKSLLQFGYQFRRIDTQFSSLSIGPSFPEGLRDTIDNMDDFHSAYLEYWRPINNFEINPSLRVDYSGQSNSFFINPQLQIGFSINPNVKIFSSLGIYHQYLSAVQEVQFTLSNTQENLFLLSNPEQDIPVLKNSQASIGANINLNSFFINIEGYLKSVEGSIARNQGFIPIDPTIFEESTEDIIGLDFLFRHQWKFLKSSVTYSYQFSDVEAANMNSFPSIFNIPHQFQIF